MEKGQARSAFKPKCPKCGSHAIGLEKDPRLKDKYVGCLTCAHRIFGKRIDEVFSVQYEDWKLRRRGFCALETCRENDGEPAFRREKSKYCSDKCRSRYSHIREEQRKKAKLSDL